MESLSALDSDVDEFLSWVRNSNSRLSDEKISTSEFRKLSEIAVSYSHWVGFYGGDGVLRDFIIELLDNPSTLESFIQSSQETQRRVLSAYDVHESDDIAGALKILTKYPEAELYEINPPDSVELFTQDISHNLPKVLTEDWSLLVREIWLYFRNNSRVVADPLLGSVAIHLAKIHSPTLLNELLASSREQGFILHPGTLFDLCENWDRVKHFSIIEWAASVADVA